MTFSPFCHLSHSFLLCLPNCVRLTSTNSATPYFKLTMPHLISNSFFGPPPPTSLIHYIPFVCVLVWCARNTILWLYIVFEILCVGFVDHVKQRVLTLVGEIQCWRNDQLSFLFVMFWKAAQKSVSLAFLQLLLLESFHDHCAVHLLILGPGLVVCCSWWLFLYSALFHSQADLLCCCCLWF